VAKKPPPENEGQQRDAEEKRRSWIRTAAGYGLPPETIAVLLEPPIDVERLKADYAAELVAGPALADLETVSALRKAIKEGNVGAAIWWTKARMGWSEKGPGAKLPEVPEKSATDKPTEMPSASSLSAQILRLPPR
jgi:hypothetical protein